MNNYGWKDLLSDTAIIAILVGISLLVLGSFPETLQNIFPFIK